MQLLYRAGAESAAASVQIRRSRLPEPSCPSASPAGSSASRSQPAATATPAITAPSETETTVENSNYRIVFTNRGAQVQHWILKHYRFSDSDGKTPLDMVQGGVPRSRFGLAALGLYLR